MTAWGPQFLTTVILRTDSFPVTNGVKQGCVLAPTLSSIVFAAMLQDASQDNDDGIQLKYRTDGGVFNLRRLKANTKVKIATLRELLFSDYCALNDSTEAEMHSVWITSLEVATTLVLPSAPRRQTSCTSLHHEMCITSHTSLLMTNHWKLPILSPTFEAPSPEKPTLTWKSITDFPKPTLHLEDSGRKYGTDEESAKIPS